MANEPQLLQAVLSSPDDDAPRLDYALWCEQQPDLAWKARAELIRLQLDRAGLDPTNPAVHGNRRRVNAIVDRYGAMWAQPLAPWIDGVEYVRGFMGLVKTSAKQFIDHADDILAHAPIQHLDLTGVRDVDEALADAPALAHIRSLRMDDCGLYDLHIQLIAASPYAKNLRWLSVARNNLTIASAQAIAVSPHLRQLEFADFLLNPADPVEQLGLDSGIVVHASMPREGQDLEDQYGYLRWLHREPAVHRFEP